MANYPNSNTESNTWNHSTVDGNCIGGSKNLNDGTQESPRYAKSQSEHILVPNDEIEYKMDHGKRGLALIFNHKVFYNTDFKRRSGTDKDVIRLESCLEPLGFDIQLRQDLEHSAIKEYIQKVAEMDHTHYDCLLIVVLSHGTLGRVCALDTCYKLESLWSPFTLDKCPTLAGKPKLFLVQACQGTELDEGIHLRASVETPLKRDPEGESETEVAHLVADSKTKTDESPSLLVPEADFLIVYSTCPGYYSWRHPKVGSWFIESFCKELKNRHEKDDLITILTFVCQAVAMNYESNVPLNVKFHNKKQIPTVMSKLTKLLYFKN